MNSLNGLLYLCRCAVNNQTPDRKIADTLNLIELYGLAMRHSLAAAVGLALQSADVTNEQFHQAVIASYYKSVQQKHEQEKVFSKLNEAGIWHMPLKGAVIKDWYPRFGMRESADVDILFDKTRAADVRDIMITLGYEVKEFDNSIHDVFIKKPSSNFEMHKALMDPSYGRLLYEYYKDVEDSLIPGEGTKRHFKAEDFYIYLIAHEYKHFSAGGTGLRSLLDTYVVLDHYKDLDWGYIRQETEKLGLAAFEKDNRILAQELFGLGENSVSNQEMLEYIVGSGTYGNLHNKIANDIKKQGEGYLGRIRYVFHRIFLPRKTLQRVFPIFYKYLILLPFLPLYRFVKGRNSIKFRMEIEALKGK